MVTNLGKYLLAWNYEVSSSVRGTSIKWQDVTVSKDSFDMILGSNQNTIFISGCYI